MLLGKRLSGWRWSGWVSETLIPISKCCSFRDEVGGNRNKRQIQMEGKEVPHPVSDARARTCSVEVEEEGPAGQAADMGSSGTC